MDNNLNPLALSQEDVIKLLNRAGCRIMTMEMLQNDIDAGMPINANGTVNLVKYMAWMIKEISSNGENESEQT